MQKYISIDEIWSKWVVITDVLILIYDIWLKILIFSTRSVVEGTAMGIKEREKKERKEESNFDF